MAITKEKYLTARHVIQTLLTRAPDAETAIWLSTELDELDIDYTILTLNEGKKLKAGRKYE